MRFRTPFVETVAEEREIVTVARRLIFRQQRQPVDSSLDQAIIDAKLVAAAIFVDLVPPEPLEGKGFRIARVEDHEIGLDESGRFQSFDAVIGLQLSFDDGAVVKLQRASL